ncbi:hypothetical protein [Paraclostridium bifermentans]|uniref:hypothetical protein n=1 Tax=Paraclostridium bifermentans TaxID=1490 RepID=UPI001FF3FC6A|nr:hypothetical protein [Paraclostridium bifermentans]MDM8128203.1 hypothetical protein [Paraclostridium benzoelyticum]UOW69552.1 hypothetical protein MTR78_16975 [Paraclostridium bifermentans]
MSLFLGKIHYWLFNKILWFENLEDEIIKLAQKKCVDIQSIEQEITLKYGAKLPNKNLEELIDTSNIHGWLQSKIHSCEGRMASWTYFILSSDKNKLKNLEEVYVSQGINAAKEVKSNRSISSAKDIYNSMNDYILDGMPCDSVNEIITLEDNLVQWKRRICVHKSIWEEEGLNVNVFYDLRNLWIESFVNEINCDFEYIQESDGEYCISIKN